MSWQKDSDGYWLDWNDGEVTKSDPLAGIIAASAGMYEFEDEDPNSQLANGAEGPREARDFT